MRFREWHLCISGFRQGRRAECGVEKLWRSMLAAEAVDDVRVEILSWDEDWRDIAAWLARNSAAGAKLNLYPYSWGGDGAISLCEELQDLQDLHEGSVPTVDHLVMCDAVYRSGILPTAIPVNPWSMLPFATIRVPSNVREVTWFYQRVDRPRGHDVVARDPERTKVNPGRELFVGHCDIDEAKEFHDEALAAAGIPF